MSFTKKKGMNQNNQNNNNNNKFFKNCDNCVNKYYKNKNYLHCNNKDECHKQFWANLGEEIYCKKCKNYFCEDCIIFYMENPQIPCCKNCFLTIADRDINNIKSKIEFIKNTLIKFF